MWRTVTTVVAVHHGSDE
jgi:hypothetical protein